MTVLSTADDAIDDSLEERLAKVRRKIEHARREDAPAAKLERLQAREQRLCELLASDLAASPPTAASVSGAGPESAVPPSPLQDQAPLSKADLVEQAQPVAEGAGEEMPAKSASLISLAHAGSGAAVTRTRQWRPVDHTVYAPGFSAIASPVRSAPPPPKPDPITALSEPQAEALDLSPKPVLRDDPPAAPAASNVSQASSTAQPQAAPASAAPGMPRDETQTVQVARVTPSQAVQSGRSVRRLALPLAAAAVVLGVGALLLAYYSFRPNALRAPGNTAAAAPSESIAAGPTQTALAELAVADPQDVRIPASSRRGVASTPMEPKLAKAAASPANGSVPATPSNAAPAVPAPKTEEVQVALVSPPPPIPVRPEAVSLTAPTHPGPLLTNVAAPDTGTAPPQPQTGPAGKSLSDKVLSCLFSVGGSSGDHSLDDFCGKPAK